MSARRDIARKAAKYVVDQVRARRAEAMGFDGASRVSDDLFRWVKHYCLRTRNRCQVVQRAAAVRTTFDLGGEDAVRVLVRRDAIG